jgi:hypothetical protein
MIFRRSVTIALALTIAMATIGMYGYSMVVGQRPRNSSLDVAALGFLLGEWEAIGTPAGETGGFTFSLGVQNHVMTRTNDAVYDAREGRPASRHDDFMIIYAEDGQLRADYFDSEQHVIRYVVDPQSDHSVVFVSYAKPSEPRYRLSYTVRADGTLAGQFEIAAPGTPDAFKPYLSWTARKRP